MVEEGARGRPEVRCAGTGPFGDEVSIRQTVSGTAGDASAQAVVIATLLGMVRPGCIAPVSRCCTGVKAAQERVRRAPTGGACQLRGAWTRWQCALPTRMCSLEAQSNTEAKLLTVEIREGHGRTSIACVGSAGRIVPRNIFFTGHPARDNLRAAAAYVRYAIDLLIEMWTGGRRGRHGQR
jgi:hypothetical protein